MLNRGRFIDICHGKRPGDVYLMDFFFRTWVNTLKEWPKQGAPEQIKNGLFYFQYFEFDQLKVLYDIISNHNCILTNINVPEHLSIPPIVPLFEPKIIEEDERYRVEITHGGVTVKVLRKHPLRMPMYLDRPVKDWATWKEYKKRLDPDSPERWPSDWDTFVKKTNSEDAPTCLLLEGFFGILREWTGLDNLLYMFYDDPKLVEDMMDHMLHFMMAIAQRVLKDIRIDVIHFWEDMAYKAGPLISPDMFRKFMIPRYRQITDFLHSRGVDIIMVDSDGDINELIPMWLDVGINFHWPLEVTARMDAISLRKRYGKDIILAGNIDKLVFSKGKKAIHEEVMSKVPFLVETGPYFPSLDHIVPPSISFEDFCYFINLLREIGGLEKLSD